MELHLKPPQESWSRRQSLVMLQESSLTAVSNIVSTKDNSRKVFKVVVLLVCLTGFLYQATTFFTYYFKYPTMVDILLEKPLMIEMPAITFCNSNGINKNKFCSRYPDDCVLADVSLCLIYPSYCKANKTMVPKNTSYSKIDNMTLNDFIEVGNLLEYLSPQLSHFGNVSFEGPFIRAKTYDGRGRMGCYSWMTVLDTSKDPHMVNRSSILHEPVVTLTFDLSQEDQFIPGQKSGMYFSVHSPFMTDNPYETGMFMKAGKLYKIHIDMMCQHKCMLDTTLKFLNCSAVFGLYPHNLRICTYEEIMRNIQDLMEHGLACVEHCKDDCVKIAYTQVVKERYISELKKLLKVEIYLKNSDIIVFRHRPQYLYIEAFSYVGGFIGIWLGISLVQLTDFVETLVRILRNSCAARKAEKLKTETNKYTA